MPGKRPHRSESTDRSRSGADYVTTPRNQVILSIVNISSVDTIDTMKSKSDPEAAMPLPSAVFHILVSLAEADRHGYAIIQDVAARTDGKVRLGPGTLYRSIQRMLEQDLIAETETRPAPDADDERRRYYRITPLGRQVARAEAERLSALVKLARSMGLLSRRV